MAALTATVPPPPVAEMPRPRTLLVGTALATAASVTVFIGLFSVYFSERSGVLASADPAVRSTAWIDTGVIELSPGGMMMTTMAMSVVTMAWAVYAIRRDDRPRAYIGLGLTALFGVAVINQTVFYYKSMGLAISGEDASLQGLLIFTITGSHLVMVAFGVLFLALMAFRAMAGQFSSRQSDGILAASIFWYAIVAVYTAIYFGIYVAK